MEVNYLLVDELDFELKIRGIEPTGRADDKRRDLRRLIGVERMNTSYTYPSVDLDDNDQHRICTAKIHELRGKSQRNITLSSNEHKSMTTRITHLTNRINLIKNKDIKSELTMLVAILLEEINQKQAKVTGDNPIIEHPSVSFASLDPLPTETAVTIGSTAPVSNAITTSNPFSDSLIGPPAMASTHSRASFVFPESTPLMYPYSAQPYPSSSMMFASNQGLPKTFQISRWGIKFNGSSAVNQFIESIEEMAVARQVSHEILFKQAAELFTDQALVWFRFVKNSLTSWTELTSRLRSAFLPADFDLRLMDEIRQRTQGNGERAEIYIAVMENLFSRLTTIPDEKTRLALIRRNLQPHFQTALAYPTPVSFDELISRCKLVEDTHASVAQFKLPPSRSHNLLEPDLAFSRTNSAVHATETRLARPKRTRTCWNCGDGSHISPSCPKPQTRHCFGCGKKNATKLTCPNCSKNGPAVSGRSATANASKQ